MARATHLTISTADRIRLDGRSGEVNQDREDEDGENEVRQEVQVSVTYALDPGDTNLVRLAEAKALEVKLAHEAVWNRIGAFSAASSSNASSGGNSSSTAFGAASSNGSGTSNGGSPNRCSGRQAPDEEDDEDRNDEDRNDEDREDGYDDPDNDPHGAGLPPDPPPVDPPMGGPARGAWYLPGGSRLGNGAAGPELSPDTDGDPITGPQKILIRSRAKKIGLTSYALDSLVFQQFKVWKVERLSKEQATLLLAALERDLKEKGEKQEKDGKEGVPHADRNGRAATA